MVEVPIPYAERVGPLQAERRAATALRFLQSIVWTALDYNPVRILGGVGVAPVAMRRPDRPGRCWSMRLRRRHRAGHLGRAGASLPPWCWPSPG